MPPKTKLSNINLRGVTADTLKKWKKLKLYLAHEKGEDMSSVQVFAAVVTIAYKAVITFGKQS